MFFLARVIPPREIRASRTTLTLQISLGGHCVLYPDAINGYIPCRFLRGILQSLGMFDRLNTCNKYVSENSKTRCSV